MNSSSGLQYFNRRTTSHQKNNPPEQKMNIKNQRNFWNYGPLILLAGRIIYFTKIGESLKSMTNSKGENIMGKPSKEWNKGYAKGQSDADRGKPYDTGRSCLEMGVQAILGDSERVKGYDTGYKGKKGK